MPLYEVQLNAYAYIGERTGMVAPVSGAALIYMEPVTHEDAAAHADNHRHDGFAMGFSAHIHEIPLHPDQIPQLLKKASDIYQADRPPACGPACKDCDNLEALLRTINSTT